MSLMFEQVYIKGKNSEEVFDHLMSKGAALNRIIYSDNPKQDENEIKQAIQNDNTYYIFNQLGYAVLQLTARKMNLNFRPDLAEMSSALNTQVVYIDHYEGYLTKINIFEFGKEILNVNMDIEDTDTSSFETNDDRFRELGNAFNDLMEKYNSGIIDYDEFFEGLENNQLLIAYEPSHVLDKIGVKFHEMYNINIDKADDVLVFSRSAN